MGTHGTAAAPAASIVPATGSEGTWTPELTDSFEKHLEWLDEKVPVLPTVPAQDEPQEHREKDVPFSESTCCTCPWWPRICPYERR